MLGGLPCGLAGAGGDPEAAGVELRALAITKVIEERGSPSGRDHQSPRSLVVAPVLPGPGAKGRTSSRSSYNPRIKGGPRTTSFIGTGAAVLNPTRLARTTGYGSRCPLVTELPAWTHPTGTQSVLPYSASLFRPRRTGYDDPRPRQSSPHRSPKDAGRRGPAPRQSPIDPDTPTSLFWTAPRSPMSAAIVHH